MSEIYSPGSIVGPAGPPTTFMGVYDASVTYSIGEAVSSGGSSYVSLINSNTGNAPTSSANWALLAAAGAAGAAGNPGTNGAASVSQIAPMINAQFPALRNLFDPSQVQGSAGLASWQPALLTGLAPNNQVSGSIPVIAGGQVTYSDYESPNAGGASAWLFYDWAGNPISGSTQVGSPVAMPSATIAVPSTAAFIRFGFQNVPGNFQVVNGATLPAYTSFGYLDPYTIANQIAASALSVTGQIASAIELPLAYATEGSTTSTVGAVGLTGAGQGGNSTAFLQTVLPLGANVEQITLQMAVGGTSIDVVLLTVSGSTATVTNRITLSFATAIEISAGTYQWTAGPGFALFTVTQPNTYFAVVQTLSGSGPNVATISTPDVAWRFDGDPGTVGNSFGFYTGGFIYGQIGASVFLRTTVPLASVAQLNSAIAGVALAATGEIQETRVLQSASIKGDFQAAGATLNIFTASGAGNVDKIIVDFGWNAYTAGNPPLPQEVTITFVIDGGTPITLTLGMFLLWWGYITLDSADPTSQLFSTEHLGIMAALNTPGNGVIGGFRKQYIRWTTSINISLTLPGAGGMVVYSNVDYYAGTAPTGRFSPRMNVFHAVENPYAAIAPGATLNLLPAVTSQGLLDSVFIVTSGVGGQQMEWLEGTPIVTADGLTYIANGCEDFFFNSFYGTQWQARNDEGGIGRLFTSGAADGTTAYWTGYRFFRKSPLLFNTSLVATWANSNGSAGQVAATKAGSLVTYYTET